MHINMNVKELENFLTDKLNELAKEDWFFDEPIIQECKEDEIDTYDRNYHLLWDERQKEIYRVK